jgi:hypothetical protein
MRKLAVPERPADERAASDLGMAARRLINAANAAASARAAHARALVSPGIDNLWNIARAARAADQAASSALEDYIAVATKGLNIT